MNKILILLISIITISSCNNNKVTIENLTLNNGERWEANIETTEGIEQMQVIIKNFNKQENKEIESIHAINSKLKKEFNLIIKSCNMEGEAHEQLHHYIKPILLNYFKKIDCDNPEDSKKGLENLEKHLNEYRNFFN